MSVRYWIHPRCLILGTVLGIGSPPQGCARWIIFFPWEDGPRKKGLRSVPEQTTNSASGESFFHRFVSPRTACDRLHFTADLIPSPGLRKRVGKMLADQEHHIHELREQ